MYGGRPFTAAPGGYGSCHHTESWLERNYVGTLLLWSDAIWNLIGQVDMICLLHEHRVISSREIMSSANWYYATFVCEYMNYAQMIEKIIFYSNDGFVQLSETWHRGISLKMSAMFRLSWFQRLHNKSVHMSRKAFQVVKQVKWTKWHV